MCSILGAETWCALENSCDMGPQSHQAIQVVSVPFGELSGSYLEWAEVLFIASPINRRVGLGLRDPQSPGGLIHACG